MNKSNLMDDLSSETSNKNVRKNKFSEELSEYEPQTSKKL